MKQSQNPHLSGTPHPAFFPQSVSKSVNPCLRTFRRNPCPIHPHRPAPNPCLSRPPCHNPPPIPPGFLPVEFSSALSPVSPAVGHSRKTNPIPSTPQTIQTPYPQRLAPILRLQHREKTNPISPSPPTRLPRGGYTLYVTQNKPNSPNPRIIANI